MPYKTRLKSKSSSDAAKAAVGVLSGSLLSLIPAFSSLVYFLPAAPAKSIKEAPEKTVQNTDSQAALIRQQAKDYKAAFDSSDIERLMSFWSDNALYVDQSGTVYKGKDEIKEQYQRFFAGQNSHPNIDISIESIIFPGKDLAVETGKSSSKQGKEILSSTYIATHVNRDGKWLLQTVSESPAAESTSSQMLKQLEFMPGKWQSQSKDALLSIEINWENKSVLHTQVKRQSKEGGEQKFDEYSFIDPLSKQLVSLQFGSDGAISRSFWELDGKNLIKHSFSREADGSNSKADYIIEPVSNDEFNWSSTGRKVSGKSLPDLPQIRVKRKESG